MIAQYSLGVTPAYFLKYWEKNDGLGKFISSKISLTDKVGSCNFDLMFVTVQLTIHSHTVMHDI